MSGQPVPRTEAELSELVACTLNDADLKSLHKDEGFRKLLVGLLNAESRSQHRLV